MASRELTVDEIMEILVTTVPRLEALTQGVPEPRLYAVTEYGWSVNDQLAHLRACHDVLGGNMLRIVREDHPAWKGHEPTDVAEADRLLRLDIRARRSRRSARSAPSSSGPRPLPSETWSGLRRWPCPRERSTNTAPATTGTGSPGTNGRT